MADPNTWDLPELAGADAPDDAAVAAVTDRLDELISDQRFTEWYAEQQFKQNLLDGKSYFNGLSPPKPATRHAPSELLQCPRKQWYDRYNAPSETVPPEGLYWFGSEFEERVIVPFLQDVTPDGVYVQNSVWIDSTVPTPAGDDLTLRGATDPVLVTADADPLLVTEIKTTSDTSHLTQPKPHHRAQLLSYLYGLDSEYDYPIDSGMLVYGDRETFQLSTFEVRFDSEFWESRVLPWLTEQTSYYEGDELPPARPEQEWECTYCAYRNRCGQADTPYADIAADGLLPLYADYPRRPVVEYLDAHADAGAKLTPTLAYTYPDLAAEHDVYPWRCPRCEGLYPWDSLEWNGDTHDPPFCPECLDSGELITVAGPEPHQQLE